MLHSYGFLMLLFCNDSLSIVCGKAWRLAREQASERHWLNNKTSKQDRCKQANKTTQAMDPGAIHVRTMYHTDTPCDITHPAYRVCACALALVSAAGTGWAGGHDQKAGTKPTTPTTTAAGIRSVLILFHLRTAPYSAIHMLYRTDLDTATQSVHNGQDTRRWLVLRSAK